jgi:hypothetical protein
VIAVADGSPQGAARLVAAWPALVGATTTREMTVVRNRARRRDSWIEAVRDRGVDAPIHSVPADPKALEGCWTWGHNPQYYKDALGCNDATPYVAPPAGGAAAGGGGM